MTLYGTDDFNKRAIDVAANKSMQIKFVDPVHNQKMEDLKKNVRTGMEYSKRHEEKAVISTVDQTVDKKEEQEERLAPRKLALRQEARRAQRAKAAEVVEQERDRDRGIDAPG